MQNSRTMVRSGLFSARGELSLSFLALPVGAALAPAAIRLVRAGRPAIRATEPIRDKEPRCLMGRERVKVSSRRKPLLQRGAEFSAPAPCCELSPGAVSVSKSATSCALWKTPGQSRMRIGTPNLSASVRSVTWMLTALNCSQTSSNVECPLLPVPGMVR